MKTFICLVLIFIGVNSQCSNYEIYNTDNINGQLPTGITKKLLTNGTNPQQPITLTGNGNLPNVGLEVNLISFQVVVDSSLTVVTSQNTTEELTNFTYQGNGTVQVDATPTFYVLAQFTQSDNTFFTGVVKLPCQFIYTFEVNSTDNTSQYNYSVSYYSSEYNFSLCAIESITVNAFYTQSQNSMLLQELNSSSVVQNAIENYYTQNINLEVNLITAIDNFIPYNNSLSGVFYLYQNLNYTTFYNSTLVFINSTGDGSLATYTQANLNINNANNLCGNVQSLDNTQSSSSMELGSALMQTAFEYGIVKNKIKIVNKQSTSIFISSLNFQKWPVAYLPWFTGGWNQLSPSIYNAFNFNSVITGQCSAGQGSVWNGTYTTTEYQVALNYTCTLSANSVVFQNLTVFLPSVSLGVQFSQNTLNGIYQAQFYIASVNENPYINYSTTGNYAILNTDLANWFVNYAVENLFIGTNVGQVLGTIFPVSGNTPTASIDSNTGNIVFTQ